MDTSNHSVENLAWAAGVFEGEGSVGAYITPDGRLSMRLSVTQRGREMVERVQAMFGGTVRKTGESIYRVEVCGNEAYIMARLLMQYTTSTSKRIQLSLYRVLARTVRAQTKTRLALAEAIKELKQLEKTNAERGHREAAA